MHERNDVRGKAELCLCGATARTQPRSEYILVYTESIKLQFFDCLKKYFTYTNNGLKTSMDRAGQCEREANSNPCCKTHKLLKNSQHY